MTYEFPSNPCLPGSALSNTKTRKLDGENQQHREQGKEGTADKGQPQRRLVTLNNLVAVARLQLQNLLDRSPHAAYHVLAVVTLDKDVEVVQQGVLDDQAAARDAEDHAQAAPQHEGARDDGLLGLGRRGEDGHEGAGELEALADGRGEQDEEVDGGGEVAAQEREADGPREDAHGAAHDGPLEPAGPGDGEADEGAREGGGDGGDDEAEAGRGGAGEEDGLEVQGAWGC